MPRFDIVLRFMRPPADGARYYAALHRELERALGMAARDVSDDAALGTAGAHALVAQVEAPTPSEATSRVRSAVSDAAGRSGTCTAVSISCRAVAESR